MPSADFSPRVQTDLTAVIAASGTTSGEVDTLGTTLLGIYLPAVLTGTAITFTAAPASGGTFVPVRTMDGSGAYSTTVAASRYVPLDERVFKGLRFIKLVSGSSEAAERTIVLATRPV